MNLPNALTVLRILLIPFFIGFLTYGHYLWALWTILIAGVTDILDGVIARMANQRTKLGAYLDPLADKLSGSLPGWRISAQSLARTWTRWLTSSSSPRPSS